MPAMLAIQKNNIGDLVLATPFLRQLRIAVPNARIDVLASTYNAGVLNCNPDIDRIYSYSKRKHRGVEKVHRVYLHNVRLLAALRRVNYDRVFLLPGCDTPRHARLARLIAPRSTVSPPNRTDSTRSYLDNALSAPRECRHIVHETMQLLDDVLPSVDTPQVTPETTPCRLLPDVNLRARVVSLLVQRGLDERLPLVALQLSARRPKQRWREESFAALAKRLTLELGSQVLLLWSPGDPDVVTHPGDDAKVASIVGRCGDLPVFACRTPTVPELVAALSLPDIVVSSDGGAMHLAAACERKVVALFGDSDAQRWHPWCSSYRVLQAARGDVNDIPTSDVFAVVASLILTRQSGHPTRGHA